jgi:hypothetical protein
LFPTQYFLCCVRIVVYFFLKHGPQAIIGEADEDTGIPGITIDKQSGTLTLTDSVVVGGNWTYIKGIVDPGTSTIIFTSKISNISGSMNFNNLFFYTESGLGSTTVGLGSPQNDKNFSVTPKVYAGFFRVLFNSSYLSRDFSEATLNMLSQTEFNKGITAKLPSNIRVSHKFGIREENGLKQLHDCGIVYYPKTPYLLCVITKGFDYDKMAAAIANISEEKMSRHDENQFSN